jgi:hypothetical protein
MYRRGGFNRSEAIPWSFSHSLIHNLDHWTRSSERQAFIPDKFMNIFITVTDGFTEYAEQRSSPKYLSFLVMCSHRESNPLAITNKAR